jgi:hypothetical protein
MLLGYTYSKAIDNGSGIQNQINPVNPRFSRALSAFDLTHNFVASYHYDLPFEHLFGKHRLSSGWTVSGITRFSTGLPVTLSEYDDRSLLGVNSAGLSIDTPDYTPGNLHINSNAGRLSSGANSVPYFNTALFSSIAGHPERLGTLGTANKRFFHGPGLNNWDLALLKDTQLTESKIFQLRFEFFNAFNHAQFDNPDGNILDSTFGTITGAKDPRIGQIAAKLLF